MESYILRENVLSDNTLHVAEEGKAFKGGYKAIIEEYYFQSAWTDRKEVKRFRNLDRMESYISKKYPDFSY
jgi:hypothetical protein